MNSHVGLDKILNCPIQTAQATSGKLTRGKRTLYIAKIGDKRNETKGVEQKPVYRIIIITILLREDAMRP